MTTSEKRPDGEWHLDEAEVSEGVDEEPDGMVLLWVQHVPTGIVARARIPGRHEQSERELKPLLLNELEFKVAWKLQIPGQGWEDRGLGKPPKGIFGKGG